MDLIIPNNIFTTIFVLAIPESQRPNIIVKESSMIINELNKVDNSIALIPSLDLIKNTDLFVSKKIGLGYDEFLTNSYLYFAANSNSIDKILLKGDVSKNEVILSKIILKERYDIDPEILLDTNEKYNDDNNYLVTGNLNWQESLYKKGVSFDEQIADLLELPYVNFIFVSNSEEAIKNFNNSLSEVNKNVILGLNEILEKIGFDKEVNDYIKSQINAVYFNLTENEIDGLQELFKLVYYHRIIDNIFDIKFV